MTDSIFTETELQIDPTKDYLPELVGDGKKFKTPADLARSVLHKDSHIARIERENKELREDLTKRLNMEDFMSKLTESQKTLIQERSNSGTPPNEPAIKEEVTNVNKNDLLSIEEKIRGVLANEKLTEQRQRNLQTVQDSLRSALGDDFVGHVETKARELGLSKSDVDELIKTKPQAFLKLMDLPETQGKRQSEQSIFSPAKSSMNTTPKPGQRLIDGHRTASQWEEVRKSNPKEYHQAFMKRYKDAIALGEGYFDL